MSISSNASSNERHATWRMNGSKRAQIASTWSPLSLPKEYLATCSVGSPATALSGLHSSKEWQMWKRHVREKLPFAGKSLCWGSLGSSPGLDAIEKRDHCKSSACSTDHSYWSHLEEAQSEHPNLPLKICLFDLASQPFLERSAPACHACRLPSKYPHQLKRWKARHLLGRWLCQPDVQHYDISHRKMQSKANRQKQAAYLLYTQSGKVTMTATDTR